MRLETDRLILRPWTEADADALYRYARDERVGPPAGWLPHTSEEDSRKVLRSVLMQEGTFAVVLKETNEAVGSLGIMKKGCGSAEMSDTEAEIGYWIGVPYWGRGLIPEAVREVQRYCFAELGMTALWCGYFDGNEKSKRVQEKCGFVRQYSRKDMPCAIEGLLRVEHFTRITREEWAEANRK